MTKKIISALAGAASLSILSIDASQASGHHLQYAPAELATDSGATEVYSRIAKLAEDVCNEQYGRHSIVKNRAAHDRCEAEIVDELVTEVDDQRLDGIHAAETQRT